MVDELTMTDGERLLRRILECPDDDAPRLIYSDWLEEQGEEERAKAIRRAIQNDEPSKCSFIDRNGVQHISTRGFISSVSLTCEVFVGGQCETCKGLGWPDFASYNARNFRRDFAPPCYKCRGTGRIEGVARELFSRNPIVDVRLTCRNPRPPGYMIGWRRGEWTTNDGLPNEIYDLLDGYFDNHGNSEIEWKSYISEADANTALSRACVAYGRNLVGLPMLDS